MDIKVNGSELTIFGNMTSLDDYKMIKEKITEVIKAGNKQITLHTPSPFAITSSAVGFFTKIVFQDKVKLTIYVTDAVLYSLMEDLNLLQTFNIIKDF